MFTRLLPRADLSCSTPPPIPYFSAPTATSLPSSSNASLRSNRLVSLPESLLWDGVPATRPTWRQNLMQELLCSYIGLAVHNHALTQTLAQRVTENLRLMASLHGFYDSALEAFATAIDVK